MSGYVFSASDWAAHGLYTNAGTLNSAWDSQWASDHLCVMVTYYLPTSATNFTVTPATAFASSGSVGGPFSPSSQVYTLTNTDTIALFWSMTTTASWLSVSPPATNSDLGIGQSTNVTVSINSAADSLSAGTYAGTINFSNTATGVSIPITVALAVGSLPPVASFTGSPTNGPALLAVTFTDTSTGSITNRFWDFGDGGTTNITTTSIGHTYAAGTYTVTLIETGPGGVSTNTQTDLIAATAPPIYTISTSASPSAGGATGGDGSYTNGVTATVTATANACYSFVNWTEGGTGVSTSPNYAFTVSTNRTLVANFASISSYTISTSSSPSGGGSTSGGGTVACGSNVTVCATANRCYSFLNWTVGANVVSTSACYSFTPAGNQTLVANFAVNGGPTIGSLTTLHSFVGSSDGTYPRAGLVQVSGGNFYGTTYFGGGTGNGSVFRISPGGSLTKLWSFTHGSDGGSPRAGLVQGNDGNFYGTASDGGASSDNGTVFRITPSGSLTTLWSFTGGSDGGWPCAGLVQGSDSNFYGTTYYRYWEGGYGAVFKISPSGSLTTLWSFTGGSDGANPYAGLVQGNDGNFYGTTEAGGASGNGTVFRISPSGSLTTLWSFTGGSDGGWPHAGLVQGSDGNFYGTASEGGASGYGTVFRITPSGSLTTLWSFNGCSDGGYPQAALVLGSDGNFYGTTLGSASGPSGYGSVFRISPSGSLTPLWWFTNGVDGANPWAGLVQGMDGSFYGTTELGGGSGRGALFKLSVPLNPPPDTINASSSPSAGGSTSGGGTYTNGTPLTVTATPNACYSFVNWTEGGSAVSTSAGYSFVVSTNRTLVANFAPVSSYTINTGSLPKGGGTTSGGGTYACGSNVTVCATPNACYSFVNWTVNGNVVSTSACYGFTPASDQTLWPISRGLPIRSPPTPRLLVAGQPAVVARIPVART